MDKKSFIAAVIASTLAGFVIWAIQAASKTSVEPKTITRRIE